MPEKVDYQGYPVKPRYLDRRTWYYEQRDGIHLLIEPLTGSKIPLSARLSWRRLEAAVDRHRAVKRKHKR